MDVIKVSDSGIKIKGKNVSLLVDPVGKVEGEIILELMQKGQDYSQVANERLVISGPGEYEAGGMSIAVKKVGDLFSAIVTEQEKVLIFPSSVLEKLADDDEYAAVILCVNSKITDDAFAPLNAKAVILYGNITDATVKNENQEKTTKINLKKDAVNGKIFLLA